MKMLLATSILLCSLPLSVVAGVDADVLAGNISKEQLFNAKPASTANKSEVSKNIDILGLQANMTLDQVKTMGVKLVPNIEYAAPSEYAVHAFYGLDNYTATNLPKPMSSAKTILLSFNNKKQLKLVQIESLPFTDSMDLHNANERAKNLARMLEASYGKAEVGAQRNSLIRKEFLPIYKMKTEAVWVSVSPVIKLIKSNSIDSAYVVKYFVQSDA